MRPGRLKVMWGLGGISPAAEVADEVDGGDDGASSFLGDSAADVVLRADWCSLGNAAVRAAVTAVFKRPAECGDEGPELGDAAAVLAACHEVIVPARAEAA